MKFRSAPVHHPLYKAEGTPLIEIAPIEQKFLKSIGITEKQLKSFQTTLIGTLVTPFSAEYNEARKLADNVFNKYPDLIVYCAGIADVIRSMEFALENKIRIRARAGGHSTAGYSSPTGGMLIDVSQMNGILVDKEKMIATFQAGCRWGQVNKELSIFGVHTPGGSCDDVGVCGYTLGGGYGYSSVQWGMACDNLVEVKVCVVDDEGKVSLVIANENENPELLWAHQGGTGGNFGIVVEMKFKLYNLDKVWKVSIDWDRKYAAQVLETWQNEMTRTLKDTKLGLLGFLYFEEQLTSVSFDEKFGIRGIYDGESREAALLALAPLLSIGEPDITNNLQIYDQYYLLNDHLLDDIEGVVPGNIKETKRCAFVERPWSLEEYEKFVSTFFDTSPDRYNIASMEPIGGAIMQKEVEETAYCHRTGYFDIFTDSFWLSDDKEPIAYQWLIDLYVNELGDQFSQMYYQNYPNAEYEDYAYGYWGVNYPTLQRLKREWDPLNVFHYEQMIVPAELCHEE